jgi:YD repeat-containing protein
MAGSVVQTTDGNGNSSTYTRDSNSNTYAFITAFKNPLNQSTMVGWDLNIGKPTSIKDPNGKTTIPDYTDLLDRLVSVGYPDGGTTQYGYNDAANTVTSTTALSASTNPCAGPATLRTDVVYDGLGRKAATHLLSDPQGTVETDTVYDALGRVYQVSNPYRSGTPVYTTTNYDSLNRPLTIKRQDGSVVSYGYAGQVTSTTEGGCNIAPSHSCAANTTTRTDDGLGRPVTILEANNNQTTYLYDPTGNLKNVNQSGQVRQFGYDSLSRLRSAVNPETGTVSYTYDLNGNVLTVAQGGVTRCFGSFSGGSCVSGYGKVNRPLAKNYLPAVTPAVTYAYDQSGIPNSIGHLTQASNGVSMTQYLGFDEMGRVTSSSQTTGTGTATVTAPFSYVYNVSGGLERETYPSGRTVTTCYDGAGRVGSVSGKATPTGAAISYAGGPNTAMRSIQYAPHGAINQMKLGSLFEQTSFNARLQVTNINLGSTLGASDVWGLTNTYAAAGNALYNNGNVLTQTIALPGTGQTIGQTYLYYTVNRLMVAAEKPSNAAAPVCPDAGSNWCEQFGYDNYGNRSMPQTSFTGLVAPQGFNAATNRVTDSGE